MRTLISGRSALMFLPSSRPLIRGISVSVSNRSMGPGLLREASSANSPLPAARTVNPSDLSNFQTEYCSCTSSSTSKITFEFTSTYSMIREPSLGSTELMYFLTDSSPFMITEIFCDIAVKRYVTQMLQMHGSPGTPRAQSEYPYGQRLKREREPRRALRNGRLVCGLPKLEIPTNYAATWRPALRQSEPPEGRLAVRQSRGAVTVPHGCQHGPNVRHRSIQLIRNRTVNVS